MIFVIMSKEEIGSPHLEEFIVSRSNDLSESGAVDFKKFVATFLYLIAE
jgi:hypothetical protein